MLQNINILAGRFPNSTGNAETDMKELLAFTRRLMQALEHNFDLLDMETEKLKKSIMTAEKKIEQLQSNTAEG